MHASKTQPNKQHTKIQDVATSNKWISQLRYDPVSPLLASENQAIIYFANKDLAGKPEGAVEALWDLPAARAIVARQRQDGSWKYPGSNVKVRSQENYNQIETYRNLGYLVEMFGFTKANPVIPKAADYLFRFQTSSGDIRGILGNQYAPYYTAGMIELLLKAGYVRDERVEKAFRWLRNIRQDDGGWAIPLRTLNRKLDSISMKTETLEPDRSQPFSHLVTGVVLRAYAAHPIHRVSAEAKQAGKLLLSRFFQRDAYPDRSSPDYWLRFTYPFWFTDLISATDSLSKLGFSRDEPQLQKALEWFIARQDRSGRWKLKTLKNEKKYDTGLWLDLSICRILKRFYAH